jgi:hypothetical protein
MRLKVDKPAAMATSPITKYLVMKSNMVTISGKQWFWQPPCNAPMFFVLAGDNPFRRRISSTNTLAL